MMVPAVELIAVGLILTGWHDAGRSADFPAAAAHGRLRFWKTQTASKMHGNAQTMRRKSDSFEIDMTPSRGLHSAVVIPRDVT